MAFENNIVFGLNLVNHGGCCCGIKTVYGFYYPPEAKVAAIPAVKRNDKDQSGGHVASSERFFHDEAPEETTLERLKRYIDYMKRRRPANILEAILAKYEYTSSFEQWDPVLRDLGFQMVTSGRNSNSGNTCYIYHLVIDEWDGPEEEDDDEYFEDDED